ncbi:Deubiquitinating enzyme A [Balamuthia mandrillaris]
MEQWTLHVEAPRKSNHKEYEKCMIQFCPIYSVKALRHQLCRARLILPERTRLLLLKEVAAPAAHAEHHKAKDEHKSENGKAGDADRVAPQQAAEREEGDEMMMLEEERRVKPTSWVLLDKEELSLEEAGVQDYSLIYLELKDEKDRWPTDKIKPPPTFLQRRDGGAMDEGARRAFERRYSMWRHMQRSGYQGGQIPQDNNWNDQSFVDALAREAQRDRGNQAVDTLLAGAPEEDVQMEAALMVSQEEFARQDREEREFREQMAAAGYMIKDIPGDGNCLFSAVADQVYGSTQQHNELRQMCMDYMERDRDHFSQFVTEDFNDYIRRKRRAGVFGNNLEIQCMSEMFARPIQVFSQRHGTEPLNIFQGLYSRNAKPIRISYHRGNHYNSVVNTDSEREREEERLASLPPEMPSERADASICPLCQLPCANYEELQVHMLTTCPASTVQNVDLVGLLTDAQQSSSSNSSSSSSTSTSSASTTSTTTEDLLFCSLCDAPAANYEELQIHMLSSCPYRDAFSS